MMKYRKPVHRRRYDPTFKRSTVEAAVKNARVNFQILVENSAKDLSANALMMGKEFDKENFVTRTMAIFDSGLHLIARELDIPLEIEIPKKSEILLP